MIGEEHGLDVGEEQGLQLGINCNDRTGTK
jgi:hypothetical protein